MRAITITGYRRPRLFRDLLVSLRANDLDGWQVFVRVEPSPLVPEFVAAAAALLRDVKHTVVVNPERLGIRLNPFVLLDGVFAGGAELALYLEEDLLLAPDATRLALWYQQAHRPEFLCLSLLAGACGSAGVMSYPGYPSLLFPARSFNSLGFAVGRQEWFGHFRDRWMTDEPHVSALDGQPVSGWDWSIYAYLAGNPALYSIQPAAARAIHTGREDGEWCTSWFHDLAFRDLPLAGAPGDTYRLKPVSRLPGPVRRHAILWEQAATAFRLLADKNRLLAMRGLAADVSPVTV